MDLNNNKREKPPAAMVTWGGGCTWVDLKGGGRARNLKKTWGGLKNGRGK